MRSNTLTICTLLLVFVVGFSLGRGLMGPSSLPVAAGQAQRGEILMAASNTQNDAFCFVYNTTTHQLASYMQRSVGGLQLRGIRTCQADFNPKFLEYPKPRPGSVTAVAKMKELAEKLNKKP